jgi:cobalt-zinc-cadmium efflux system outer membrane protein
MYARRTCRLRHATIEQVPILMSGRWLLGAICLLGAASTVGAQETLTLERAIAEAAQKNVGLLAERANISVAEARVLTARLRPNPVVSASADHMDLLGTGFNEVNGAGPPEYSMRVDFPIERGNKRALRTEVAQISRTVTELLFQNVLRSIALDIANLFVDAQQARETLSLAKENEAYFDQIVGINQARLRAGEIAEVELLRSRLASLQERNEVREAQSRWRTALLRLQTAIGRPSPSPTLNLASDIRHDETVPVLERVRETALLHRPDLLALRRDLNRAQAEVRSQEAQAKVDAAVGTEYRRQQGVNGIGNSIGVFLAVPLPVFDRNQGEIERARQEQRQAGLRIRQLELLIGGEVEVAHEEVLTASTLLRNIEGEMLAQAQEVRRVTEFAYRRGHVTLLELLDAQHAYNQTVQGYIEARAAYARTLYVLDAASGKTVTQ